MPIQIPTGFCQAAFEWTGTAGTSPYVATLGLDTSEAGGDFVQVANQAMQCMSSNFNARLSNQLILNRVILTVGQDSGEQPSVLSTRPPSTGTRAGTTETIAIALLINKRTAQLGRPGRGRMFLPAMIPDGECALEGALNQDFIDDVQEDVDQFMAQLSTGVPGSEYDPWLATPPVLLHSSAVDGIDPSPLLAAPVSQKVGVLRKRLR